MLREEMLKTSTKLVGITLVKGSCCNSMFTNLGHVGVSTQQCTSLLLSFRRHPSLNQLLYCLFKCIEWKYIGN